MSVTFMTCLLLATVLAPVGKGDCTVVVNGANTLRQMKGREQCHVIRICLCTREGKQNG